jgi:hypothetical protein
MPDQPGAPPVRPLQQAAVPTLLQRPCGRLKPPRNLVKSVEKPQWRALETPFEKHQWKAPEPLLARPPAAAQALRGRRPVSVGEAISAVAISAAVATFVLAAEAMALVSCTSAVALTATRDSPPHIRSQEEAFAAAAPLPVTAAKSEMPRYGPEASAVRGTRWRTPADSAAGACSAILPREDRSPRPPHWRLARRPRRERMVAAQRRRIWVGRAALLAIRLLRHL